MRDEIKNIFVADENRMRMWIVFLSDFCELSRAVAELNCLLRELRVSVVK